MAERPIANAFGIGVWAIATRGLGTLAWMHRRSTIACSVRASGPSLGPTSWAPIERSAILSDVNSWRANSPMAMIAIVIAPAPAAINAAMRMA